jgi:hypothetical protein
MVMSGLTLPTRRLFTGFWPPEKRKELLVAKNLPKTIFENPAKPLILSRRLGLTGIHCFWTLPVWQKSL